MERATTRWLSTEQCASLAGMTPEWVRQQVLAGRLVATVWTTGSRRTYRINAADWAAFRNRWARRSDDPRFG